MSASPKHPLTNNERKAIKSLYGVTFAVASWDKRFARDVLFPALDTEILGVKAVPQLWRIVQKYRRQLRGSPEERGELLKLAVKWSAPDFRKVNAAANEAFSL